MTMTVAQLIAFLQHVEKEHGGDVRVYVADRDYGPVEIHEGSIDVIIHDKRQHRAVVL